MNSADRDCAFLSLASKQKVHARESRASVEAASPELLVDV
jgi:hypothetical protein